MKVGIMTVLGQTLGNSSGLSLELLEPNRPREPRLGIGNAQASSGRWWLPLFATAVQGLICPTVTLQSGTKEARCMSAQA